MYLDLFIYLFIYLVFILLSCNKDKNYNVCQVQTFSFYNEAGNDLFGMNIPDSLNTADLKVYNLSGEELQVIYGEINGIFEFDIYLLPLDRIATVHIGNLAIDTIEYQFREEGNSQFVHKVYYNRNLKKTYEQPTQCNSEVIDIVVEPYE